MSAIHLETEIQHRDDHIRIRYVIVPDHHISKKPKGGFFGPVFQEVGAFFLRCLDLLELGGICQCMEEAVTSHNARYLGARLIDPLASYC